MSQGVEVVGLYVRDQDEALAFYVEQIGFRVHTDVRNGDYRWLTVQHPDQPSFQLGLFSPGPPVLDAVTAQTLRAIVAKGAMPPLVLTVDDCRAAYERMREEPFTLLLTDIVMPEMDGIELARRATELDPDLKVMVNGGYYDVSTPYFEGKMEMRHLPVPPNLQANVEYHYYPSGHMVYVHPPSLIELHNKVADFIRRTSAGATP